MTPRYRTAFSCPSGFTAATPVATQTKTSIGAAQGRKSVANTRSQSKPSRDTKTVETRKSAAA